MYTTFFHFIDSAISNTCSSYQSHINTRLHSGLFRKLIRLLSAMTAGQAPPELSLSV